MSLTLEENLQIAIVDEPINSHEIRRDLVQIDSCGGLASFEGLIRNTNHGKKVVRLEYEAYMALAQSELKVICEEAIKQYDLRYALVHHRIGKLDIGDVAVIIYTLSQHRDAAFKGCRYIIDQLKVRVPIWKKEFYEESQPEWTRCSHHHDQANHL